jgi:hypothetical protein
MPILSILAAVTCAAQSPAPAPELVPHEELARRLRAVASEHPGAADVLPYGRSREGRELLALRMPAGEPPRGKPAILVVANIEGPEVFSSALALWQAEEIARRWFTGGKSLGLLDSATLYVVARANPDAAEARFRSPRHEQQSAGRGVDNDRDGRQGEDPPSDVDGDGLVTSIRVVDPEGEWIEDPADARAMIRAEAGRGEVGRWKLWPEGRDLDGDERVAEDPEHDTWLGRNFAQDWREHDPTAGLFPMDEPEARALADFAVLHKDIALVLTYGAIDNLVEKPKSVKSGAPATKRVPAPGVIEPDAEVLAEIGRRYAEITGAKAKSRGEPAGSFQEWIYQQRGLLPVAVVPWDIPLPEAGEKPAEKSEKADEKGAEKPTEEAAEKPSDAQAAEKPSDPKRGRGGKADEDKRTPSDDAKRLKWIDAKGESSRFVPWKRFEHPELGEVEIGGFAPHARSEPPEAERAELAAKHLEFLTFLGGALPRVELGECELTDLGGGLLEVEAALTNRSLVPALSASAARTDTVRRPRVVLKLPEGATVVAGLPETLVRRLGGAGAREELRWLVHGAPAGSIGIEVDTDSAGTARCVPEVKR